MEQISTPNDPEFRTPPRKMFRGQKCLRSPRHNTPRGGKHQQRAQHHAHKFLKNEKPKARARRLQEPRKSAKNLKKEPVPQEAHVEQPTMDLVPIHQPSIEALQRQELAIADMLERIKLITIKHTYFGGYGLDLTDHGYTFRVFKGRDHWQHGMPLTEVDHKQPRYSVTFRTHTYGSCSSQMTKWDAIKPPRQIDSFTKSVAVSKVTEPVLMEPREWIKRGEKFGYVATGIPGRSVRIKSLTHGTPYANSLLCEMRNFLTDDECDELIAAAKLVDPCPKKSNDLVINTWMGSVVHTTGASSTRLEVKDGSGTIFAKVRKLVESFMSDTKDTFYSSTIKRYAGEESKKVGIVRHEDGNLYTVIIYLTDVPKKNRGATVFPNMGVQVQPVRGRAVWFHNYHPTDVASYRNWCFGYYGYRCSSGPRIDSNLSHEGEPVLGGEKIIMQFLS